MSLATLHASKNIIRTWTKEERRCSEVDAKYIVTLVNNDYLVIEAHHMGLHRN